MDNRIYQYSAKKSGQYYLSAGGLHAADRDSDRRTDSDAHGEIARIGGLLSLDNVTPAGALRILAGVDVLAGATEDVLDGGHGAGDDECQDTESQQAEHVSEEPVHEAGIDVEVRRCIDLGLGGSVREVVAGLVCEVVQLDPVGDVPGDSQVDRQRNDDGCSAHEGAILHD